jgi:ligand-binding sensor domain-containing protein
MSKNYLWNLIKIHSKTQIIVWICFFIAHRLVAQSRLTNLQRHLPDDEIRDMLLNPDGSLWLGTNKGLVLYDGTTTKRFLHDPNNVTSISGNSIRKLFRTPKSKFIWILTGNDGLSCYDPKKIDAKAFTNYPSDPNHPNSPLGNSLEYCDMDEQGHLWLAGQDCGLTEFDPITHQFVQYKDKNIDATIWSVAYTGNNSLWLATQNGGLARFDTKTKQITRRWLFKEWIQHGNHEMVYNTFSTLFFDKTTHTLWAHGDKVGLISMDLTTEKVTNHPLITTLPTTLDYHRIVYINQHPDGKLWLGHSSSGLFIYNPTTRTIERQLMNESPSAKAQFPLYTGKTLHDSHQNITWIGTDKGLFLLDPTKNHYAPVIDLRLKASEKIIFIQENVAKNMLWVFTNQQLLAYNARTFAMMAAIPLPKTAKINMWSALKINAGNVYIHTSNQVWMINEATKSIQAYPFSGDITSIMNDTLPSGEPIQWLGTYNKSLYRFRKNGTVEHFTHLPNEKILGIYRQQNGVIWLCHDNKGLARIEDKEKVTFNHFINDPKNPNSLSDNIPLGFLADSKQRLWLTTASNGITLIENPNDAVPRFWSFNLAAFGNPFLSGIHEDADKNLWLTSFGSRPVVFNPQTQAMQDLQPGMEVLPDYPLDSLKMGSGNECVWVANRQHIFKIDATEQFVFLQQKLPIHFAKLTVFDRDISERLYNKVVELSYQENFFSIEFSAINFKFPKNTHYFYQLEGVDKDWVDAGSRHIAYYTNLSGGKYVFKVRASPDGNRNNATEATLPINIHPPFWHTWWFCNALFLILGSTIYAFGKYRLQIIRKEEQLKSEFQQKLSESRFEILRSQMNPHFIFNCLNTIEAFILTKQTPEASVFLQKFSKLIRKVLENSRHNAISLEQEAESLQLYLQLERIRYDKKFDYEVNIDDNLLEYQIPPMLIQPFIENAILHGIRNRTEGVGWLKVSIEDAKENIAIQIIDNGIGRERANLLQHAATTKYKHSLGMKLTEERLKMFNPNTQLVISDTYPNTTDGNVGTSVRFLLPKKYGT